MKILHSLLIVIILSSTACKRINTPGTDSKSEIILKKERSTETPKREYSNDYMLLGVLYHQQAAEYRALCYQAYNIGRFMLDKDLADKSIDKNRAVILDIDETVLDNSPYQAECILSEINYPERWDPWCQQAKAKGIPGSLEFLNYARMNGVSVYYITNRKQHLKKATIDNLVKLGYPMSDEEHVIMRTGENSKEGRRQNVLQKHHISLLFGDNLSDFNYVFDSKSNPQRMAAVDELRSEFGERFIVLPNSMYGDWETELYKGNKSLNDSIKHQLRLNGLTGF